jgi:hypothetical protein
MRIYKKGGVMKIPQFIMIVGVLAISIPGTYYSVLTFGKHADEESRSAGDLAAIHDDIKLLKSELFALKKANAELNKLKQDLAQLNTKKFENVLQAQIQNADIKGFNTDQDETQMAQMNPMEMGKQEEEKRIKEFDLMNTAFLAETSDPQWAPDTTTLLSTFFESDVGAKIKLSDLECRKTLCKVEISKPDDADANNALMLSFPMHVSKALAQSSIFYTQNEDGTTRVTLYLARNGYELPTNF